MRQLELIARRGRRSATACASTCKRYAFGNATWPDLIALLDARTPEDLAAWSRAWVEEPGRPDRHDRAAGRERPHRAGSRSTQRDPVARRGLRLDPAAAGRRSATPTACARCRCDADAARRPRCRTRAGCRRRVRAAERRRPRLRRVRPRRRQPATICSTHLPDIDDPLTRGSAWVTLWEQMLDGRDAAAARCSIWRCAALPRETRRAERRSGSSATRSRRTGRSCRGRARDARDAAARAGAAGRARPRRRRRA